MSDSSGEAFYLRDEDSGHFWSPTPLPCGGASAYECRHGFGVSTFEHVEDGIRSQLVVTVSLEDAIKFSVLKVSNESGRARRLSVTSVLKCDPRRAAILAATQCGLDARATRAKQEC